MGGLRRKADVLLEDERATGAVRMRGRIAAGLTLELLLEDCVVLYPNLPLLLVDGAADDVLHLLESEERLARLRVDALPQCAVDVGRRRHTCGGDQAPGQPGTEASLGDVAR